MKQKAKSLSENNDAVKEAQAKIDGILSSGGSNRSQGRVRSPLTCAIFSSLADTLSRLINQNPASKKVKVGSSSTSQTYNYKL